MTSPVLAIENLVVRYPEAERPTLDGLNLTLAAGDRLALVGPSGCGKSTVARAVLQLLPPGSQCSGSLLLAGQNPSQMARPALRQLRGEAVGLVFQDPMTRLNPLLTIGDHLADTLAAHRPRWQRRQVRQRAETLLTRVGIGPERYGSYPHEFSGGMRQRLAIALAMALEPPLVIADEPTTSLDVAVAGQVMAELSNLCREAGSALLLISHDLAMAGRLHQAAPHIRYRRGQQLVAGTLFHQAAVCEDGDPLAPTAGHGQVVADQQQGAARFGTEVAQLSHHLGGDGHIQAGGGFIGDHQGRVQGQGQGDRQPLAHATAELVRIAAITGGIDADPLQQALGPFETALAPVGLQGVPEVFTDGHQRIEPRHRVLKHQPHRLPPQLSQGTGAEATGILAGELEPALAEAARGQQLQYGPGHGAFAAAGGAHQGEGFPLVQP